MMRFESEYLDGGDLHKAVIRDCLLKARRSIWIATANLKDLHVEMHGRFTSLVRVLGELSRDGIDIRILHSGNPSGPFARSYSMTQAKGSERVKLRRCPRSHFKSVLIDEEVLYLGSANLTGAGLGAQSEERRNFEMGILTRDPRVIREVRELYHLIWEGEFCPECGHRKHCSLPIDAMESN